MYNAFFGTEMPLVLRFVIAFVVVLALIAGLYYLVRRFGAGALDAAGVVRGRQPRLAVIDAASVDGRRRLLLIRRDNVEHLIMIGGPTDVVIEPNIVRATAAVSAREAAPARAADILPRAVPLAEEGIWPVQPESMQRTPRPTAPPAPPPAPKADEADADWPLYPEPAPKMVPDTEPRLVPERELRIAAEREPRIGRELRVAVEREPRAAAEPEPRIGPERDLRVTTDRELRAVPAGASRTAGDTAARAQNSERLAGLATDLSRNYTEPLTPASTSASVIPPPPPPPVRGAEPRRPPPVPASPIGESEEQNLAEMAQQLESVLQRPRPATAPAVAPPAPRTDSPPAPPRAEANPANKPATKPEAKPETKPEAKPAARTAAKPFDNLEQEMASLLGRPSGKA